MCCPTEPPKKEMGFDTSLLKNVLEQFVDEIGEESIDLIEDRPRFAHAVVVVADDYGELCQASCIRQLDNVILHETHIANVDTEWIDEEIQRALKELTASKELLDSSSPQTHTYFEEKIEKREKHRSTIKTTKTTTSETIRNPKNSSIVDFPSMRRERSTSARRN